MKILASFFYWPVEDQGENQGKYPLTVKILRPLGLSSANSRPWRKEANRNRQLTLST